VERSESCDREKWSWAEWIPTTLFFFVFFVLILVTAIGVTRKKKNYVVISHQGGGEATVSTHDLALMGVNPWDQETSKDLILTGSKLPLGELESISSGSTQNMPSHLTSAPVVQNQA